MFESEFVTYLNNEEVFHFIRGGNIDQDLGGLCFHADYNTQIG
jgi:hypothetical protein